jgi:hypothetical protein
MFVLEMCCLQASSRAKQHILGLLLLPHVGYRLQLAFSGTEMRSCT